MNTVDIHTLLPVGEKLKPLLNKSAISESDMKNLLKRRGVFLSGSDKKAIVPYLTMSLLSPKEFEELQELQKTKEDALKFRNKSVKSKSDCNLAELIETSLVDVDEIEMLLNDCSFHTDADFKVIDSNKMVVDYEILRSDLNKDWASTESKFNGRVEIVKNVETQEINVISEYTSNETEEINGIILDKVLKTLKEKDEIEEKKIFELTSDNLSNEERFEFLLSLTQDSPNSILKYKSVRNIEIGPDKTTNLQVAPSTVVFDNSVKNIIINGEKGETLQNIEYVTNKVYHKALILRAVQIEYKFNVVGASGTCIIEYGFPHFFRSYKKSKVFEVTINKLWFDRDSVSSNTKSASRKILNEFNHFYIEKYRTVKSKGDSDLELTS